MKVLVAARDIRVRRALSGLLELVDHRTVGAEDTAELLSGVDADVVPDVVVLELDRRHTAQDLRVIERLAARGCTVIAVCSGTARRSVVLAAGAEACLDEEDPGFADRLAETVRTASGPSTAGGRRRRPDERPDR
jgi:DNA-binding NtrC family response regulator